jgi:hypothetical protein
MKRAEIEHLMLGLSRSGYNVEGAWKNVITILVPRNYRRIPVVVKPRDDR